MTYPLTNRAAIAILFGAIAVHTAVFAFVLG